MWVDAQRDGRPGGTLCKSSVIPFLVPRCKVWLTPAAGVPCSNVANIGECKTWTRSTFSTWQYSCLSGGSNPPKMHIVYQPSRWPNIVQSLVGLEKNAKYKEVAPLTQQHLFPVCLLYYINKQR